MIGFRGTATYVFFLHFLLFLSINFFFPFISIFFLSHCLSLFMDWCQDQGIKNKSGWMVVGLKGTSYLRQAGLTKVLLQLVECFESVECGRLELRYLYWLGTLILTFNRTQVKSNRFINLFAMSSQTQSCHWIYVVESDMMWPWVVTLLLFLMFAFSFLLILMPNPGYLGSIVSLTMF